MYCVLTYVYYCNNISMLSAKLYMNVLHYLYFGSSCIVNETHNNHCIIIRIYNGFTTNQRWCKCVSKYGICDINTVVNLMFFIYYSGNVTYTIFTYTFARHLINSTYNVHPNYCAVNKAPDFLRSEVVTVSSLSDWSCSCWFLFNTLM